MKKSEIYHKAQILVLQSADLTYKAQAEMLRELFVQEDLAKMVEEKQEAVEG